jgi:hypothetical protein
MGIRLTLGQIPSRIMKSEVVCACSEVIMKSVSESESKIRSKVLIVKESSVYAVCKSCGSEVEVPLKKALPSIGPRLILNK